MLPRAGGGEEPPRGSRPGEDESRAAGGWMGQAGWLPAPSPAGVRQPPWPRAHSRRQQVRRPAIGGMLRGGRARGGGGSVAACVWVSRLALPHRGEGAAGPGREEGGWGRPPTPRRCRLRRANPQARVEELRPGGGGAGLQRGAGAAPGVRVRGKPAGGDAAFLQRGASPLFKT